MARFSLGKEEEDGDEGTGPSSSSRPSAKKQKTAGNSPSSQQPPPPPTIQPPPPPTIQPPPRSSASEIGNSENEELLDEEAEEIGEEESDHEVEAEWEDSDFEEEEDGEDEGFDEGLDNQQHVEANETSDIDGSISVTLTDPDVLDCPICLESLSIPVFQCENGHIACSSCSLRIGNRCPSCCWPIGYNRCRAIEKVIEAVKISCRNMKYGCKEMLMYCNKHEHEKSCKFAPCSCPLLDCNYVNCSQRLYAHFSSKHFSSADHFVFSHLISVRLERSQKFLILQEAEGMLFILNHFDERSARAVSVLCIGPTTSRSEFSFEITARDGDTACKLISLVENMTKWLDCPPARRYLLIPNHYTNVCGQLTLELCIRKIP